MENNKVEVVKKKRTRTVAVTSPQVDTSVDTFISQALASNVPVETMERLFTLREKVKAEKARESFVVAMANFQRACPVIEKKKVVFGKDGTSIRYKYAPMDSIIEQVKEAIGSNNLSYTFDEEKDEKFTTVICKVTHALGHSETSSFKIPIGEEAFMNEVQKYGARMTFAKRYAFLNAFGISTGDEDLDNNGMAEEKTPQNPKAKIMFLLRSLGFETTSGTVIAGTVLNLTKLELIETNYNEIVGRLEVILKEKNEDNKVQK